MKVLVTGGAGFIGSHIVDLLLAKGHSVRILDNLEQPTHRDGIPPYLSKDAEFLQGDVRNRDDLGKALDGVEVVFHQAATGGFTPHIEKYIENNSLGTARLLETIRENPRSNISKIIVASSVGVYGEGKYLCRSDGVIRSKVTRTPEQMASRQWESKCPLCGEELAPQLTDEDTCVVPAAAYSVSKYDQERLVMSFGRDENIPVVALRYFLTYGPRQSVYNAYTGVCSIFSMRILNGKPVLIYEDGKQTRDFVFVADVARANLLVMEKEEANYQVFNVGTGTPTTIRDLATMLGRIYRTETRIECRGAYRLGDARHIVADVSRLQGIGYSPGHRLVDGLREYEEWIRGFANLKDYFADALMQLEKDRVVRGTGR